MSCNAGFHGPACFMDATPLKRPAVVIPCKEEARHEKPSLIKYTVVNELSSPQFSTIFAGSYKSKHPHPVLDPPLESEVAVGFNMYI